MMFTDKWVPVPIVGAILMAVFVPLMRPTPINSLSSPLNKQETVDSMASNRINSAEIAKAYPACVPYLRLIKQEALRVKVRPSMFLGLIIYESGCNPSVVSRAGAVGLGQVMPDTAIAGRPSATALIDPQTNLMWSANILRGAINLYKGNEALGLARYNGSAGTPGGEHYAYMVYVMERRVREWRVFP